jgi:hypothetical protein
VKPHAILALFALLVGCVAPTPPPPAPIRDAAVVATDFQHTWDAAIDHFAEGNIPIATIERASGILATSRLSVGRELARQFSDCGKNEWGAARYATSVVYNVLVRGDSSGSTVRVTASWSTPDMECSTTGAWEAATEEAIQARAEGRPAPTITDAPVGAGRQAIPEGARFVASASGDTVYPLIESCKAWQKIEPSKRLFFPMLRAATSQGFKPSKDEGCGSANNES